MGLLYTRSIGALMSKAKYILSMNSDDMFLDKVAFSILKNIIYKGNFDIIIYNLISTNLKPDVYTTKLAAIFFDNKHKPNWTLFQSFRILSYYPIQKS